jgi:hypothetical protein
MAMDAVSFDTEGEREAVEEAMVLLEPLEVGNSWFLT